MRTDLHPIKVGMYTTAPSNPAANKKRLRFAGTSGTFQFALMTVLRDDEA